jgi:adenine C2-methylase RlmN of 23S rRNA A2503 and tRNA A37
MEITKKDFASSILFFAKEFGKERNYQALLDCDAILPELTEDMICEIFLHKFNPHDGTEEQNKHYEIIFNYYKELREVGYVEFV